MTQDQKKEDDDGGTPDWLEKLQQESWQAEILISGGVFLGILGLINDTGSFLNVLDYSTKLGPMSSGLAIVSYTFITLFLAEGFFLSLVLRGYWIGLIGMNYVFPKGIDKDKLAFKGKFSTFIKEQKNTPYLIKLDQFCSQVFGFTFLVIASLLGLMFFSFIVLVLPLLLISHVENDAVKSSLSIFAATLVCLGILNLVDFFSFGRLRKIKWFAKVFYPIHYLISILTLSFFYRRLYYTVTSNIKPPYILLFSTFQILATIGIIAAGKSSDLPRYNSGGETSFLNLKEDIIPGRFLQFSILLIPRLEDELIEQSKKDSIKSFDSATPEERLKLISSLYEIYVDSLQLKNIQWHVHSKQLFFTFRSRALVTTIDLSDFKKGAHQLIVRIRSKSKDYLIDPKDPKLDFYAKADFYME